MAALGLNCRANGHDIGVYYVSARRDGQDEMDFVECTFAAG